MERKTIKNYIYNLSYQLLTILLPLITTPYISRTLKVDAIGSYSYSMSIVTYFSLFGIMGLNIYGQLQIAKERKNDKVSKGLFNGIFFAKLFTSAASLLFYFFFIMSIHHDQTLFMALGILIVANIFDISWFFKGLEMFKNVAVRNYIIKILSLILIFVLVKDENDLIIYALIIHGSTFLGNISLWLSYKQHLISDNKSYNIFHHIKNSFVYFIPTIASSIYTVLDANMLGIIKQSDYENGIYEQAHKIEQAGVLIIAALSQVMLPQMVSFIKQYNYEGFKNNLYVGLKIVGFIAIPMIGGLFAISDTFIPLFLGEGYEKCILLLKIFSFLIFFSGLNTFIGNQCLVARNMQSKYNVGVICGAISNFIMNMIFINLYASAGAAIASVLAEIIIFIVFLYFNRDCIKIKSLIKMWYKPIIATVIMTFSVLFIGNSIDLLIIRFLVKMFVGIIIYLFLCIILKDDTIKIVKKNIFNRIEGE